MNRILSATLLAWPMALGGCAMAALGTAAVAISQEFIENAEVHYIEAQPDAVWSQAKVTLDELALDPIEVDEANRAAGAVVDSAKVTLLVTRYDSGHTKLSVGAKKWALYNSTIANEVAGRIKRELQ